MASVEKIKEILGENYIPNLRNRIDCIVETVILDRTKVKLNRLQLSAMENLDFIKFQRAVERLNTLKDLELITSDEMENYHKANELIRATLEKARK